MVDPLNVSLLAIKYQINDTLYFQSLKMMLLKIVLSDFTFSDCILSSNPVSVRNP